jgi:hypothetical protein
MVAVLFDDTELALGSDRWEMTGVGWPLLGCDDDVGACEEDTVGFRRNRPSWPRKLAPLSDGRRAAAALFDMMRFLRSSIAAPSIYHASSVSSPHMEFGHEWLYKITIRRLRSGPGHNGVFGNVWGTIGEGRIFCREMDKFPGESRRWTGGYCWFRSTECFTDRMV